MRRRWMQVAFPMLACVLGLAQHRSSGAATPPARPPATAAKKASPLTGTAIRTSGSLAGPPSAPRNGVLHPQRKVAPVKNAHQPHRERFPNQYQGDTAIIPLTLGFPVAYGGSYLDEPAGAAQQTPPEQADNHPPANNEAGPAGPAPQGAANTDAPRFRPLYQRSTLAPVLPQPATTLIFNDGRPRVQVHNYALTVSTLYALDGESGQEIPLSLLNVPATIAVNRTNGIDFALPRTP